MNSIDETMLMSLFAHTQQKVIAQDIFERYNINNLQAVKAALVLQFIHDHKEKK